MYKAICSIFSKCRKAFLHNIGVVVVISAFCFGGIGCARSVFNKSTQDSEINVIWKNNDVLSAIAVAPNHETMAAATGGLVKLWSISSLTATKEIRGKFFLLRVIKFSPDGKYMVGGGSDGHLYMWKASTGEKIWQKPQGSTITALCYSPDGSKIASAGHGGRTAGWAKPQNDRVRIWDASTGKLLTTIDGIHSSVRALKFVKNDKIIIFEQINAIVIQVFEVDLASSPIKQRLLHTFKHKKRVAEMAISSSGDMIATGGRKGNVSIWHLSAATEMPETLSVNGIVTALAFSPLNKELSIASLNEDSPGVYISSLLLWDIEKSTEISSIQRKNVGTIGAVAFLPDSKGILYSGFRTLNAWDYNAR